ncbi:MAG: hypothetical protein ACXWRA_14125 [Pseudobdellovibrionaceae bacterium]
MKLVVYFTIISSFFTFEAEALKLSSSKSVKCFDVAGGYFQMVFPKMREENLNGTPRGIVPGDVCYKFVTVDGKETSKFFPASKVAIVQNGPDQALTLFDNNEPIAYIAWGYVNGFGADPQTKGANKKWAPWDIRESKLDLDCELYKHPISVCP